MTEPLIEIMMSDEDPFKDCEPTADPREKKFRGLMKALRSNYRKNLREHLKNTLED